MKCAHRVPIFTGDAQHDSGTVTRPMWSDWLFAVKSGIFEHFAAHSTPVPDRSHSKAPERAAGRRQIQQDSGAPPGDGGKRKRQQTGKGGQNEGAHGARQKMVRVIA